MNSNRTKNATLNIIFSILLQLVFFIRGLILPRIIIPAYGSDVNGLISSITQFLGYISLLEAGVGSIFRTSLYKPLAKGDIDAVSGIINEQKTFYRKIGAVFAIYVGALCIVYPLIAKTQVGRLYIISTILILCVSTFTEYFVSLPYVSLLSADQKIRISYVVSIVYSIVNILVTLFCVSLKADIRLIYVSTSIIGLLRPLFYTLYVKKHYILNKNAKPDKSALDQRWNGMVHHFAYYIHTNTATAILTVFISTAVVSIYNIYGAIVLGVERIITSVSTGAAAGLGNLIAEDNEKQIKSTVNLFEFVQCSVTTVFYTITVLMIIPFVRIFTVDMTDINYIEPLFAYVFILAEFIYCFRCVYSTISTNANKYKETQKGAVLECVVNLVMSLILIIFFKLGILGVAIGSLFGMLSRYLFEINFLSKEVLNRSSLKALKMLFVSLLVVAISIVLCNVIFDYESIKTMFSWVLYAAVTSLIVICVSSVVYCLTYKEVIKKVLLKFTKLRRG